MVSGPSSTRIPIQRISSKSPDILCINCKRAIEPAATYSEPAPPALRRQLDGFPMSKVTRVVAVFLAVATSGLLAAVPVVATWRIPAGQCIAPAPTSPLKLGEQAAAMPLVVGQCTIAAASLKQPNG